MCNSGNHEVSGLPIKSCTKIGNWRSSNTPSAFDGVVYSYLVTSPELWNRLSQAAVGRKPSYTRSHNRQAPLGRTDQGMKAKPAGWLRRMSMMPGAIGRLAISPKVKVVLPVNSSTTHPWYRRGGCNNGPERTGSRTAGSKIPGYALWSP